jgi:hypothetical protein
MAVTELPLVFPAVALLTQAVAVVVVLPAAQAVQVAVVLVAPKPLVRKDLPTEPMAQSTRAVAAVVRHHALTLLARSLAAQAALASS